MGDIILTRGQTLGKLESSNYKEFENLVVFKEDLQ